MFLNEKTNITYLDVVKWHLGNLFRNKIMQDEMAQMLWKIDSRSLLKLVEMVGLKGILYVAYILYGRYGIHTVHN